MNDTDRIVDASRALRAAAQQVLDAAVERLRLGELNPLEFNRIAQRQCQPVFDIAAQMLLARDAALAAQLDVHLVGLEAPFANLQVALGQTEPFVNMLTFAANLLGTAKAVAALTQQPDAAHAKDAGRALGGLLSSLRGGEQTV